MKQYILLFLIIISNQLRAEEPFWEKLPGPNIGEVICFADLPNGEILIGAYTGVYKSSDLGKNWHQVFNSFRIIDLKVSKKGVIAIITGEYIYSPSCNYNMFLSYDNGQTWNNILRADYEYMYNKIVFTDKEELLIFTLNKNQDSAFINKTSNYGKNWQKSGIEILNNSNYDYYYDHFFDSYIIKNNIYLTGYRRDSRKNIYENYLLQSSDYGKSFSKVLSLNTMSVHINNVYEDNSGVIYVNYADSIDNKYLIRKSTDSCKTWQSIPCNFRVDKFEKKGNVIIAYERKKLINDRYNFIYATTDEGQNWIKLNPDKKFYYINFNIINDSLVLLAHYEGIELTNIKTNRSENAAKGLASGVIYDIGFVKNKVFVTCGTGVYVSSDDGMTWESCNANSQVFQRINTLSDGTLVLTGVDHYYDRVYEYGMLIS